MTRRRLIETLGGWPPGSTVVMDGAKRVAQAPDKDRPACIPLATLTIGKLFRDGGHCGIALRRDRDRGDCMYSLTQTPEVC